jgi:mannose-6-phosphate isomerase-like protein (cupin superfamily)
MGNIPIRHLPATQPEKNLPGNFSIRDVEALLAGKDMLQTHHRHDFFLILALTKGLGTHEIDFTTYEIGNNSFFFMRPGQLHQLHLKAESKGFILQFSTDFYHSHNRESNQWMRKVSNTNYYQLDAHTFQSYFLYSRIFLRNTQAGKKDIKRLLKLIWIFCLLNYSGRLVKGILLITLIFICMGSLKSF